jgi:hypothetical protein
MHIAQYISNLVHIATINEWHTLPFEDVPNAPTLASLFLFIYFLNHQFVMQGNAVHGQ